MAVTKIHGIKTTVDKAIEYICNPDKTDEKIYISSFACAPETAALDFKYTLDHTTEQNFSDGQDKENKAFHLIQAFLPCAKCRSGNTDNGIQFCRTSG